MESYLVETGHQETLHSGGGKPCASRALSQHHISSPAQFKLPISSMRSREPSLRRATPPSPAPLPLPLPPPLPLAEPAEGAVDEPAASCGTPLAARELTTGGCRGVEALVESADGAAEGGRERGREEEGGGESVEGRERGSEEGAEEVGTADVAVRDARGGAREPRHMGHVLRVLSHWSTHSTWNMCPHWGSFLSISPSS